jgi:hypothetical protein
MAFRIPPEMLKVFIDEGIVPADCASLVMEIPASGAIVLRFEVFARPELLGKIARAFTALDRLVVAANRPIDPPDTVQ